MPIWLFWSGDSPEGILASDDGKLEVREKRGVRLAKDEQDGPRVGDLHLGDPSVVLGVAALELRVDDPFEGGDDVPGVERTAVAEAQAVAETHLELRRAQRVHRLGEIGDHFQGSRVDRHQRAEKQPRDAKAVRVADEARVELLGVPREHDDQGVRVVRGRPTAAKADH